MSNRLSARRGQLPLPAVCASKQKWFDQVQAGQGLPTPIFAKLEVFDTQANPLPRYVEEVLALNKEPTELRWSQDIPTTVLHARAIASLNPIDLTWTLEVDWDFLTFGGIQPRQMFAQAFLPSGQDPQDRVGLAFDLHGPRFTIGRFYLQWF